MKQEKLITMMVSEDHSERRLDHFIASKFPKTPRSLVQKCIRTKKILRNNKPCKAQDRLQENDSITLPLFITQPNLETHPLTASQLDYWQKRVLYQDEEILVINKPAGIAVHGGTTIQQSVISDFRRIPDRFPFIELAHRIDRQTSGCLCLALSHRFLRHFQSELQQHNVSKTYLALVVGSVSWQEHEVSQPLQMKRMGGTKRSVPADLGKMATTRFKVVSRFESKTLMQISIVHGRLHQIRAHAVHLGIPVCGDTLYDPSADASSGLMLHASNLTFTNFHEKVIQTQCEPPWANRLG